MRKTITVMILNLLITISGCSISASAMAAPKENAGMHRAHSQQAAHFPQRLLFTIKSHEAVIKKSGGGYILKLSKPTITSFTDRPARKAESISTREFINLWTKGYNNFKQDNPNAYIASTKNDCSKNNNCIVILSAPEFHSGALQFKIKPINKHYIITPSQLKESYVFVDMVMSYLSM